MAFYYLETSAVAKLYIREVGSDRVLALAARSAENRLAILSLTQVELRSAIRRREKAEDIAPHIATHLLETFGRHLETRFVTQPFNTAVLDFALALIDRHALRAFDAIQLGGYLAMKAAAGADAPIFVSADQALLAAARADGLQVFDPSL